ncbi:MAG: hypothetical protein DRQ88_11345 [Epsilonproteobacteria bacterium]|nr:MAG: hypothetical protein DRQ88_11345 [Campylobacterota bacterium]RLA65819.1 MAG: hypothetical protein DRQ89_00260 [Campylobacterota bacterium]
MRCFENIAKLIRTKRINHPKSYSQSELSNLLGYKNGQFISNVERALCNIPLKMLGKVSEVLEIHPNDLKRAMACDLDRTLDNYLTYSQSTNTVEEVRVEGTRTEETGTVEVQESEVIRPDWKQAA